MTYDANLVRASTRIYTRTILSVYDLFVVYFSSTWVWHSPRRTMLAWYAQHVSANHLDIGVGTGYFLDHCTFPSPTPTIALADISPRTLEKTVKRIRRYQPTTYLVNALDPLEQAIATRFDSIGMNFVLHCIPGSMDDKAVVFRNVKPLLRPGGVLFGTTILPAGVGVRPTWLANAFMAVYNALHIFNITHDSRRSLERALGRSFDDVAVHVVGCVAFFVAR
jgi:SAM-dependent methyltransferase